MAIENELLRQLLAGRDPGEGFAENGLLDDLKTGSAHPIQGFSLQSKTAIRKSRSMGRRYGFRPPPKTGPSRPGARQSLGLWPVNGFQPPDRIVAGRRNLNGIVAVVDPARGLPSAGPIRAVFSIFNLML